MRVRARMHTRMHMHMHMRACVGWPCGPHALHRMPAGGHLWPAHPPSGPACLPPARPDCFACLPARPPAFLCACVPPAGTGDRSSPPSALAMLENFVALKAGDSVIQNGATSAVGQVGNVHACRQAGR